ncbi:hypothetical protein ACNOYE_36935 [Nannocystaceae bacterium ST9]
MPRPNQPLVRIQLRQATRSLRRSLFSTLPGEAELERIALHPLDETGPAAGSRPQTVMLDADERRYLFKLAPPEHVAAELFAHRLRELGRRLHVPTARRTLELPGLGRVTGMLQPQIPVVGPLDRDPQRWSAIQREAMLREHPWEWLLANLDTHVDQYVLVGEHQLPINIDWDHSLLDLQQTRLTRFNRRSLTVAPIRNLLYSEYVLGRIRLDFHGMQLQARNAAEVPDAALAELVDRHARELGLPDDARLDLRERMLRRKADLVTDFDALVESLRHEREDNLGVARTPRARMVRALAHAQDAWQRFAIVVLHTHVLRPTLRAYRGLLRSLARIRSR